MPRLWNQPVGAYLNATGQSTGWTWVALVSRSDIFNLIGISVLSGWSAVCLLAVIPLYAEQRDWPFVVLCVAEVAVLVLAASNVLAFGH
jgi:glucose dehydrogenase